MFNFPSIFLPKSYISIFLVSVVVPYHLALSELSWLSPESSPPLPQLISPPLSPLRRYSGPCPLRPEISLPLLVSPEPTSVDQSRLVVSFSDPSCRSETLVGGKAASLALLTELDLAEAVVPRGVVVTARGYRHQLRHQPGLTRAADRVVRVSAGVEEGELSQVCDR